MLQQKEEAETLRLEMILGMRSIPDVVAWADGVVAADPNPDPELLELTTCARCKTSQVLELLTSVRGECDRIRVSRRILGGLRKSLLADSSRGEQIARSLFEFWMRGLLPEPEFGVEPSYLEEFFDLAGCGAYGTRESALADLDEYLAKHELAP